MYSNGAKWRPCARRGGYEIVSSFNFDARVDDRRRVAGIMMATAAGGARAYIVTV
jgi:hypothetical protein